jgi:phosphatidylglycerophosphate synthase
MRREDSRRPVRTRDAAWALALGRWLSRARVKPNTISALSIIYSALAGFLLVLSASEQGLTRGVLLAAAGILVQLRLLCNLLDGLVAIEGGSGTKSGEIFNDLPDRFSDLITLVCAGYSVGWVSWATDLGWAAGALAVLTAYVRVLGGFAGARVDFSGPMAKQQRMATVTAGCLLAVLEPLVGWNGQVMTGALLVVVVGSMITLMRRLRSIVNDLESQ